MTILIRREKLDEPLDPLWMPEELPSTWSGPHVGLRLVEAACLSVPFRWPRARFAYRHLSRTSARRSFPQPGCRAPLP